MALISAFGQEVNVGRYIFSLPPPCFFWTQPALHLVKVFHLMRWYKPSFPKVQSSQWSCLKRPWQSSIDLYHWPHPECPWVPSPPGFPRFIAAVPFPQDHQTQPTVHCIFLFFYFFLALFAKLFLGENPYNVGSMTCICSSPLTYFFSIMCVSGTGALCMVMLTKEWQIQKASPNPK